MFSEPFVVVLITNLIRNTNKKEGFTDKMY